MMGVIFMVESQAQATRPAAPSFVGREGDKDSLGEVEEALLFGLLLRAGEQWVHRFAVNSASSRRSRGC